MEFNHIEMKEVYLPDLNDGIIRDLNDKGICLRFFSQNYNNYYINTETASGFTNREEMLIEKAMEFKLKKRSNTINKLIHQHKILSK